MTLCLEGYSIYFNGVSLYEVDFFIWSHNRRLLGRADTGGGRDSQPPPRHGGTGGGGPRGGVNACA